MQNQSVCTFTLIFCVGTWLFRPVNYYCLMLLWLRTIPRNKKMLFPNFLDVRLRVAVTQSSTLWWRGRRSRSERMEIDTVYAEDCSPNHNFSSICYHFSDFLLYQKWYHFHSNEVRSRAAQHYHLPIDDYANSYTVHRCNKRKRDGWRKRLLQGPESSQQQRNGFGFL